VVAFLCREGLFAGTFVDGFLLDLCVSSFSLGFFSGEDFVSSCLVLCPVRDTLLVGRCSQPRSCSGDAAAASGTLSRIFDLRLPRRCKITEVCGPVLVGTLAACPPSLPSCCFSQYLVRGRFEAGGIGAGF
jgi:hypothetical protein